MGSNPSTMDTAVTAVDVGPGYLTDARPLVTVHKQNALRLLLAATIGAVISGLIVGLVVRKGSADVPAAAVVDNTDGRPLTGPGLAACPKTLSNGSSLRHLGAYSQYGLPADGHFYAGHAARVVCGEGFRLADATPADHVLLCRLTVSGTAEWSMVSDATGVLPNCELSLEPQPEPEVDVTRQCCAHNSSVYVTANSDCLRGGWVLGGSATAPTWTGQHGADDEPWIGWRGDLLGGIWIASIGPGYITCDWTLQNEQDYGSQGQHPIGCTEGNEAPPSGAPSSCTRWQANSGYSMEILPADFSVQRCKIC
eukprot:COSAG02_NODE_13_length_57813_cov_14.298276_28_plen_310_part_00